MQASLLGLTIKIKKTIASFLPDLTVKFSLIKVNTNVRNVFF